MLWPLILGFSLLAVVQAVVSESERSAVGWSLLPNRFNPSITGVVYQQATATRSTTQPGLLMGAMSWVMLVDKVN